MTDYEREVFRNIMYAVETGGEVYGQKDYADFTEAGTNTSTEIAITIGAGQWYAGEAKRLLNLIRQTDSVLFNRLDTAGIAKDLDTASWSTYDISKTSAKAKCIVAIIDTEVGHACQDELMGQQAEEKSAFAASLGVTNLDAQMMIANFDHLGGEKAVKRILRKTPTPYTLDNIYNAALTDTEDNQVGTFRSRNKKVYDWIKEYITNYKVTPEAAIEAVVGVARGEVGYLEKKSNSQLDSKKENAGSNNYTKYWRDTNPENQGSYWCACFVTWVLEKAFDKATAKKMLGMPEYPYVYVDNMRAYRSKDLDKTPKVGDIVVFWDSDESRFHHTGLVVEVNGNSYRTVEGNTSAAAGVENEGQGVYEKPYTLTSGSMTRFVHLDYSLVSAINNGGSGSYPFPKEDNFKATGIAYCTGDGVRVRATPGGTVLGSLDSGDQMEVDGVISGDWVHMKTSSTGAGYMHKDYVRYEAENETWNRTGMATCTGDGVYVRKTPNGSIIGKLYKGDQFETDGTRSGEWVHVKVAGAGVGYIHQDYVSTSSAWTKTGNGYCTGDGVYVRATPGGEIRGQLYQGDTFEVDGKRSGSWIHIKSSEFGIGYIHQDYVAYRSSSGTETSTVKKAQKALNSYFGLGLTVDGAWGSGSEKAYIKAIQMALNDEYGEGLSEDGAWGPATRSAISAHVLKRGDQNNYVAVLQIGLLAKGYNLTSVDAVFGSDTESKLISFQKNEGLTADGKAGLATMTILAGR